MPAPVKAPRFRTGHVCTRNYNHKHEYYRDGDWFFHFVASKFANTPLLNATNNILKLNA